MSLHLAVLVIIVKIFKRFKIFLISKLLEVIAISEAQFLGKNITIGKGSWIRSGAIFYDNITIGEFFSTGHYVLIRDNVEIGDHVSIGSLTVLEGDNWIGNRVNIQSQCNITRGVVIKDDVFIGPGVITTNDKYPPTIQTHPPPTVLYNQCVIGAGVVILPNITIGWNSLIGAGSVVTRDIPSEVVAYGNPCRVERKRKVK